jgi:hypothetical protein
MAGDPQAEAVGKRLLAEIARAQADLAKAVTVALFSATPRDTGHAAANWVPSAGEPYVGEDEGEAQAAGIAALDHYKVEDGPLYVSNSVPYMPYLIAGSSEQAPPGWDAGAVDQAVAAVQQRYDAQDIDVTTGPEVIEMEAG